MWNLSSLSASLRAILPTHCHSLSCQMFGLTMTAIELARVQTDLGFTNRFSIYLGSVSSCHGGITDTNGVWIVNTFQNIPLFIDQFQ